MADRSDKKSDLKNRIPTLHELVTPGKITPHRRHSPQAGEDELRALVEEVVKRHMEHLREEIVSHVLADLKNSPDHDSQEPMDT